MGQFLGWRLDLEVASCVLNCAMGVELLHAAWMEATSIVMDGQVSLRQTMGCIKLSICDVGNYQKLSGDPNPQYFSKSTDRAEPKGVSTMKNSDFLIFLGHFIQ